MDFELESIVRIIGRFRAGLLDAQIAQRRLN
jgi:hypothetical protein